MSLETDRIEADLNESRHRLNDTLEQLGSKLSPGQMLDEALGLAQGQAGEFVGKLGRQVKDNPMPTLLIAAGVGMLMLNRGGGQSGIDAEDWRHEHKYRSLEEARWSIARKPNESDAEYEERVHDAYARTLNMSQRADEAIHEFKARVTHTVDGIKRRAESARSRMSHLLAGAKHGLEDGAAKVGDAAQHQAERVGERASAARHRVEDFYDDSPLAAGAIALAVGALIGSATPLSRPEREALSGVADEAVRKGADLAERGARAVEDRLDTPVH
jgi:ElaB/YqjD/DUF883 family membrane-anchored ribosome-binding protein